MTIVAELSANHLGSLDVAKESLHAAKEAGADAIKIQVYRAKSLTLDSKDKTFLIQENSPWDGKYLYDLYKEAQIPDDKLEYFISELYLLSTRLNFPCFASAFSIDDVNLLERFNNPVYKIASFEIHDIRLIRHIAKLGKPIILSTGIATLSDIDRAVNIIKGEGVTDITLLKCVSTYPAKLQDMNLINMPMIGRLFKTQYGLSDHTLDKTAAISAVSLGASMIEKHFMLDMVGEKGSPDSSFSLGFKEFKEFSRTLKDVKVALGDGEIGYTGDLTIAKDLWKFSSSSFGRSIFAIKDIKKGEILTEDNIASLRPRVGLGAEFFEEIIGKKSNKDIKFASPIVIEDIN